MKWAVSSRSRVQGIEDCTKGPPAKEWIGMTSIAQYNAQYPNFADGTYDRLSETCFMPGASRGRGLSEMKRRKGKGRLINQDGMHAELERGGRSTPRSDASFLQIQSEEVWEGIVDEGACMDPDGRELRRSRLGLPAGKQWDTSVPLYPHCSEPCSHSSTDLPNPASSLDLRRFSGCEVNVEILGP